MKHLLKILLLSLPYLGLCQISITDSATVENMVLQLQGDGVIIENVTSYFPLNSDTLQSPIASFEDQGNTLGMEKGLLITNGAAKNALGPNDRTDKDQINYYDEFFDPELEQYLDEWQTLHDLTIIEFDITVYAELLSFNYVFASEEYPEFLDFNDVFGFFISGPGINGVENLALIPGTNTPVSVSNINPNINPQYYISNGMGVTPFNDPYLQYDGYTTTLRAERLVTPCETYHIKLAIADVNDSNLDSGVFLEEGSFSTKKLPHFTLKYEHERFPFIIEGCNDLLITVNRDERDLEDSVAYDLQVSGTSEGEDISPIPFAIEFSEFQQFSSFNITAFLDSIDDPYETLILTLLSNCDKFPVFDQIEIPIRENFDMTVESVKKCGPGEIILNENPILTDYYEWNENPTLSCLNCSSPTTSAHQNTTFNFEVIDSISGCEGVGTQFLAYENIKADFEIVYDECKTTLDVEFINNSFGGNNYYWNFGDDKYSVEKNVSHTYNSAKNKDEPQFFWARLTVENIETGCKNVKAKKIEINEPFFTPNVITPNNDFINEDFVIKGINKTCWSLNIYNRWGKLVFHESPFQNRFSPQKLSDGTYYFQIVNEPGNKEFKGVFNVLR